MLCHLRLRYYSSHNKAGKCLAFRLKSRRIKSNIPFLYHPSSKQRLTNPQHIADAFADYYGSLYNLKNDLSVPQPSLDAISSFVDKLNLPSLSPSELIKLNRPFCIPEIQKIIKTMPCGKSPGPYGFINEYYHTFSSILSPYLATLFNTATYKLTFSLPSHKMLRAHIVTLPKPGENPDCLANFQPISLFNTAICQNFSTEIESGTTTFNTTRSNGLCHGQAHFRCHQACTQRLLCYFVEMQKRHSIKSIGGICLVYYISLDFRDQFYLL